MCSRSVVAMTSSTTAAMWIVRQNGVSMLTPPVSSSVLISSLSHASVPTRSIAVRAAATSVTPNVNVKPQVGDSAVSSSTTTARPNSPLSRSSGSAGRSANPFAMAIARSRSAPSAVADNSTNRLRATGSMAPSMRYTGWTSSARCSADWRVALRNRFETSESGARAIVPSTIRSPFSKSAPNATPPSPPKNASTSDRPPSMRAMCSCAHSSGSPSALTHTRRSRSIALWSSATVWACMAGALTKSLPTRPDSDGTLSRHAADVGSDSSGSWKAICASAVLTSAFHASVARTYR